MTPRLTCRKLSAGYGDLTVLRDIDIELSAGRVLAVLGPNGAGKSTMLMTIAGLVPRLGGDVLDLFPALRKRIKLQAGALSGGEQQMLALARALVQRPRVLLVDEMSMGLAPVIVEELLPVVRGVAAETGAVVVLVEQHVQLALEIADEAIVLVHGETVLAGDAKQLVEDLTVLEAAYLGAANGAPA
jgi:branched-chain amino acid transport system ATP-binding protein